MKKSVIAVTDDIILSGYPERSSQRQVTTHGVIPDVAKRRSGIQEVGGIPWIPTFEAVS